VSILPDTTNTYDIGSDTYEFKDAHFAGIGDFGSLEIGGCLPEDTLILTNRGAVKIVEVKPGDMVYAYNDGKLVLKKVTALIPQGKKPTYKLVTGCRTIEATVNHPFLVCSHSPYKNGHPKCWWRPLGGLKPKKHTILVCGKIEGGQPYKLPKIPKTHQNQKDVSIPEYTNEDFMRIVGFFIGDGHVHGRYVHLYEPENGKFRDKYVELVRRVFGIEPYCCKTRIIIGSIRVANLFRALGLNKKSWEKTVPGWVFQLPLEQRLAFIEGYCDADGYRYTRKCQWDTSSTRITFEFASVNKLLIEQVRLLCITCGLRVSNLRENTMKGGTIKSEKRLKKVKPHKLYRFYARPLRRKLETNKPYITSKVRSIEYIGEKEVYDLSVEGVHNFVANGIIVHNSTVINSSRNLVGINALAQSLLPSATNTYDLGSYSKQLNGVYASSFRSSYISSQNERGLEMYRYLYRTDFTKDFAYLIHCYGNMTGGGMFLSFGIRRYTVKHYDGAAYTDLTAKAAEYGGSAFTTLADTDDVLYFGHSAHKPTQVYFDFSVVGAGYTLVWEYWNGTAWTTLTVTDETSGFTQDGWVYWSSPTDWATTTVDGVTAYWVRVRTTTAPTTVATATMATRGSFSGRFLQFNASDYTKMKVDYRGSIYTAGKVFLGNAQEGEITQSSYYLYQSGGVIGVNTPFNATSLKIGTTEVIDSSRNLLNIVNATLSGDISCNDITMTGVLEIDRADPANFITMKDTDTNDTFSWRVTGTGSFCLDIYDSSAATHRYPVYFNPATGGTSFSGDVSVGNILTVNSDARIKGNTLYWSDASTGGGQSVGIQGKTADGYRIWICPCDNSGNLISKEGGLGSLSYPWYMASVERLYYNVLDSGWGCPPELAGQPVPERFPDLESVEEFLRHEVTKTLYYLPFVETENGKKLKCICGKLVNSEEEICSEHIDEWRDKYLRRDSDIIVATGKLLVKLLDRVKAIETKLGLS